MSADKWPRIAVLGAGAVGCYFGGLLARAGASVTLIGRAAHMVAISVNGLILETLQFQDRVRVAAETEVQAIRDADVVLLCVKTLDTETAARQLAPHLAPGASLLSLQNGVDNVERIRLAVQIAAIPVVVYVAAAMVGPGHVKHTGRGDLVIGEFWPHEPGLSRPRELADLADLFARAGILCRISGNIHAELWTKLIINCAYNAISALARANYGRIVGNSATRALMEDVIKEGIAVAAAEGIHLPQSAIEEATMKLGDAMKDATSSTAQDIARGKRTEIDSLNGYVVRRGMAHRIPTPVSQTLHGLVKLLEEAAYH